MTQFPRQSGYNARRIDGLEAGINQRVQELHDIAQRFADQMGPQFDTNLDFTVGSLTSLDDMLGKMVDLSEVYWSDRTDDLLPVALALTAYVGEVFRRSFAGASWITEHQEGEIPPPHIRLSGGLRINLMKKSVQILTGADSASFASYYQTVRELTTGPS